MPDTHTTSVDQQRLEKERIEDDGTVTLTRGGHAIHCLTVIGQIEGHVEAPQGQKTTKYEHVIPQLVAVQEDPAIEGLLVLLNTASVQVVPATVVAIRQAAGSSAPFAIMPAVWITSLLTITVGVTMLRLFIRLTRRKAALYRTRRGTAC